MAGGDGRPSIRWAGIAFGALFALVAALGVVVTLDAGILGVIQDWVRPVAFSVGPSTGPFLLVLAIGAGLLVLGAVALVRRARRKGDE